MYNTDIQLAVSIRGYLVFLEYSVTEDDAVEWWLNPGSYPTVSAETDTGIDLLETLLRTHENETILARIKDDFQARVYAHDAAIAALTDDTVF